VEGVNGLNEISCARGAGLCLVSTDGGGNGSRGNVISSSDPGGGTGAWIESNVYGNPLRPPDIVLPFGGPELPAMSCMPEGMCVATEGGSVMVGTAVPAAPMNTAALVLSGTPSVGQTISCSQGAWTGFPSPTFAYQWLRDGTPIGGASASTYIVQDADQDHTLACQVTAVNSLGSQSAMSNTLQVPAAQTLGGGGLGAGGSSGGGSPGGGASLTGGDSGGGSAGGSGNVGSGTLASTVSNTFVLTGLESVAARGSVKITLTLPGPGTLQLVGKASAAQLAAVSVATCSGPGFDA
jgi:hypothetical protein